MISFSQITPLVCDKLSLVLKEYNKLILYLIIYKTNFQQIINMPKNIQNARFICLTVDLYYYNHMVTM